MALNGALAGLVSITAEPLAPTVGQSILIGGIGAAFVITQYHTTVMFAPNVVGQANATSAGWGNLGGGVTQFVMPLLFSVMVIGFGFSEAVQLES